MAHGVQTQAEVEAKIRKTHGDKVTKQTFAQFHYVRANKPATFVCEVHGPWKAKPCDIVYGSWCPACGHAKKNVEPKPAKVKTPKVAKVKAPKVATPHAPLTEADNVQIAEIMERTGTNRAAAIKRFRRALAKAAKQ
jgi:hypothetical protein